VHFGNSGTEANEAALKYARLFGTRTKGPDCRKIACFTGAFHGRTMGALSVTPNASYREPFEPLIPDIVILPYNDCEALNKAADDALCGIIVEVIQGEGGLRSMTKEFAQTLNRIKKDNDVLVIADEIQTGLGRTGYPFASDMVGLEPDIITIAKPLAGGLPMSATLIPKKVNDLIKSGEHGTTFGGGPVVCAVASYMLDKLLDPHLLSEVRDKGDYLRRELETLKARFPVIASLKGAGLLQGIKIAVPQERAADMLKSIIEEARLRGLLLLRSGTNVVRIAPPLVISREELIEGLKILENIFATLR